MEAASRGGGDRVAGDAERMRSLRRLSSRFYFISSMLNSSIYKRHHLRFSATEEMSRSFGEGQHGLFSLLISPRVDRNWFFQRQRVGTYFHRRFSWAAIMKVISFRWFISKRHWCHSSGCLFSSSGSICAKWMTTMNQQPTSRHVDANQIKQPCLVRVKFAYRR